MGEVRSAPRGALGRIRVVECAEMVAGPFCGRLLAGFGADVLKVEPLAGDAARRRGPFVGEGPDRERSALFLYLNVNKRSVCITLESPTGCTLLHQLLETADVLIEDFPPDRAAALGLDSTQLGAAFPRLVVASITPFGQTGPYRTYRAYDLNVFHGGGEGFLLPNGLAWELFPDRAPLKPGGQMAEYHAGLTAAVGILAALHERLDSGRGQHVDCSKQEAQFSLNYMAFQRCLDGTLETRANRAFRYGGVIPCRDGHVELLTLEQRQWEALVAWMGSPAWAGDARFAEPVGRGQHGAEINRHLRAWFADKPKQWLYEQGQARGVPVAIYAAPDEVLASPQLASRGFFAVQEHPAAGRLQMPTWPLRCSQAPLSLHRPAPGLGEHTAAVLREALGYDGDQLRALAAAGVI